MKLSEIYTRAAIALKEHKVNFICYAVQGVKGASRIKKEEARAIIMARLSPNYSYTSWVERVHPEIAVRMSRRDRQGARIQWCQALAAEFKAKGQ